VCSGGGGHGDDDDDNIILIGMSGEGGLCQSRTLTTTVADEDNWFLTGRILEEAAEVAAGADVCCFVCL